MLVVAVALGATDPAGAQEQSQAPSTSSLRAARADLVRRIAALTDTALRAQQRAADARARRAEAEAGAEAARLRVAELAVEAFTDALHADEMTRLRRKGWADVVSDTDRRLLGELRSAQAVAEEEATAGAAAVAEARLLTERLQQLRAQLEGLIAEREQAERKAAEARRRAAATVVLSRAPRHARTTRGQAELFARFPFGPVRGVPAGLAPTGVVISGPASWYGPGFDGRPTASGAIFDQEAPTVAHRTLPLGTILLIHHNGRSVLALVNDRGPFVGGRVLDLSRGVAAALGTIQAGVARVSAEVLTPAG